MTQTGYGYCQCGCGRKTELAEQTRQARGWIKGEPKRFILGHATRRQTPRQTCSFDGCEREVLARGMCATHYQREAKARNPEKFNEYRERWNERHPGRAREQGRARYKRNPEAHITTGRLVSPEHMSGVHRILDYMLDAQHFTHQLPRASRECEPHLLAQHPDLATVEVPDEFEDEAHIWRWVGKQAERFGAELEVARVREPVDRDPIDELVEMRGGRTEGIIVVAPEETA